MSDFNPMVRDAFQDDSLQAADHDRLFRQRRPGHAVDRLDVRRHEDPRRTLQLDDRPLDHRGRAAAGARERALGHRSDVLTGEALHQLRHGCHLLRDPLTLTDTGI